MSEREDEREHDEIGCLEAIESLYAYLDGALTDAESVASVERHLAHCRSCYSRSELERRLAVRLREQARSPAPAGLQERLRDLLDKL